MRGLAIVLIAAALLLCACAFGKLDSVPGTEFTGSPMWEE